MIDPAGITVWTLAPEEVPDDVWPRVNELLDAAERHRATRFLLERHQRQFGAAHALKRLMLSAATGGAVGPADWLFETAPQGKPRVAGGSGPHFSISHCDGLVACAVGMRSEVGVDAERIEQAAPVNLARAYFTPSEQAWLDSLAPTAQPAGFIRLWTLKEAFLKASGRGLSQPLDTFGFGFEPLKIAFHDPRLGQSDSWRFLQQLIHPRHCLAVAWRAEGSEVPVHIADVRLEEFTAS